MWVLHASDVQPLLAYFPEESCPRRLGAVPTQVGLPTVGGMDLVGNIAWLLFMPVDLEEVRREEVYVCSFRVRQKQYKVMRENKQCLWVDMSRVIRQDQTMLDPDNVPLDKIMIITRLKEVNRQRAACNWKQIHYGVKEHLSICPSNLANFLLDDAFVEEHRTACSIAKAVEASFRTKGMCVPRWVVSCPCCGLGLICTEEEDKFMRKNENVAQSMVVRCLCETSYVFNRSSKPFTENVDGLAVSTVHFSKQISINEGAISTSRSGPMHMPSTLEQLHNLEASLFKDVNPQQLKQIPPTLFDAAPRLPVPVAREILDCSSTVAQDDELDAMRVASRSVAVHMASYMKNIDMTFWCIRCGYPQELEWGSPCAGRKTGVGSHQCVIGLGGDKCINNVSMDVHMMVAGDVVHHSITYVTTPIKGLKVR